METEKIPRLLAQLAIPAVVAQIINLLYNIVDRIYIGHIPGVGAAALTGVGLFTPILMLINAFAMLAGSGGAPRAAISMGKKDNATAEKILGNCFSLLILMAVALTVIFFAFAPQLLTIFGASDKTLPYGVSYARIYILGSIFVLIVMGMNPFITTQGFAKISMMTTVIGAVINIILDPVFIFVFDLGVSGAAIATVLSQAVGAIWILRFLSGKKTILHLRKENFKLQKNIILPCLGLGISTFVMLSTESILSISFTSSLSRYGGDLAVGAMTIITSVSQLATLPLQGICQGGQPIMSYNFGAGNPIRVRSAFRLALVTAVLSGGVFFAATALLSAQIVGMFIDPGYPAYAIAVRGLPLFASGFVFFAVNIVSIGYFQSVERPRPAMAVTVLRGFVFMALCFFLLPQLLDVSGAWLAVPLAEVFTFLVVAAIYWCGRHVVCR